MQKTISFLDTERRRRTVCNERYKQSMFDVYGSKEVADEGDTGKCGMAAGG